MDLLARIGVSFWGRKMKNFPSCSSALQQVEHPAQLVDLFLKYFQRLIYLADSDGSRGVFDFLYGRLYFGDFRGDGHQAPPDYLY
jgi:hypothetical protein